VRCTRIQGIRNPLSTTCVSSRLETAQILEALHINDTHSSASIPTGLVIANDSDYKRAGLLVHQSSRLPSPALIVTNVDASIYPHIKVENTRGKAGTPHLLFDRILADVPCSGDGTLRKNPIIWRNWHALNGNGLHGYSFNILARSSAHPNEVCSCVFCCAQ
jgi:multisite-specific tRNA:(cytosine-C5)-methyltransferase